MWFFPIMGVGVIGVIVGGVCLMSQRKSLFGILLSMEILTLGIYIMIFGLVYFQGWLSSACLIFLAFGVCEAALGLSVLVSLIRNSGSDYVGGLVLGHF
uniref:NADH-ubiquinone oxidoreductase chain 4L n=2 Tax=Unio TaxID=55836 RepID=E5EW13_UNIPI|nr:NADH dehydrogenase subunit 4L [Unio pictorum]YP_010148848.1 NADH dehydrogenase subunit 4L [Unio mancus]ADE18126.1 NADH dehydrogenase subunit 4L [Unio pictorum]ADE18139.1 NADH dehydrogenase subunit 4L [Unio pictorum]ADE18152.1 NADH dehydrogenase subunit 4L [Unio pictorum]ADE18165.1 NADH dehydrogenase subunit 4L [Unio pictorum]ADE18178.1 NADH dehydrogenase subunit 4L [Unio pictorum]